MLFGENMGVTGALLIFGSLCVFFGGHHYLRATKAYRRYMGNPKALMEYHSIVEPVAMYAMAFIALVFGSMCVAGYFIERQEEMSKPDPVQKNATYLAPAERSHFHPANSIAGE